MLSKSKASSGGSHREAMATAGRNCRHQEKGSPEIQRLRWVCVHICPAVPHVGAMLYASHCWYIQDLSPVFGRDGVRMKRKACRLSYVADLNSSSAPPRDRFTIFRLSLSVF